VLSGDEGYLLEEPSTGDARRLWAYPLCGIDMRPAILAMTISCLLFGCAQGQAEYRKCRYSNNILYSCVGYEKAGKGRPSPCVDEGSFDRSSIVLYEQPDSTDVTLVSETGEGIPFDTNEIGDPWTKVRLWTGESGYLRTGEYSSIYVIHNDAPSPYPASFRACAGYLF